MNKIGLFFSLFAIHFVSEFLHRHAKVIGLTESLREALENEWMPLPSNDRLERWFNLTLWVSVLLAGSHVDRLDIHLRHCYRIDSFPWKNAGFYVFQRWFQVACWDYILHVSFSWDCVTWEWQFLTGKVQVVLQERSSTA